ncbi:MAG: hypothetical protein K6U87_08900 [Firmicutes bacterium]|nr:hypothetical protein [Bacillota bacterium]
MATRVIPEDLLHGDAVAVAQALGVSPQSIYQARWRAKKRAGRAGGPSGGRPRQKPMRSRSRIEAEAALRAAARRAWDEVRAARKAWAEEAEQEWLGIEDALQRAQARFRDFLGPRPSASRRSQGLHLLLNDEDAWRQWRRGWEATIDQIRAEAAEAIERLAQECAGRLLSPQDREAVLALGARLAARLRPNLTIPDGVYVNTVAPLATPQAEAARLAAAREARMARDWRRAAGAGGFAAEAAHDPPPAMRRGGVWRPGGPGREDIRG